MHNKNTNYHEITPVILVVNVNRNLTHIIQCKQYCIIPVKKMVSEQSYTDSTLTISLTIVDSVIVLNSRLVFRIEIMLFE